MADRTALERCEFCQGTLVVITRIKNKFLVQCEDCGMVTESYSVVKHNDNGKMKKVRKLKRRYHE